MRAWILLPNPNLSTSISNWGISETGVAYIYIHSVQMTSDVCYAKKIKYNLLHNCLNTNYAICPDTDLNCSIKTSPTPLMLTLLWQRMLWKGQVNSLCKLQLFLYVVKIMSQYQSLRVFPFAEPRLIKSRALRTWKRRSADISPTSRKWLPIQLLV